MDTDLLELRVSAYLKEIKELRDNNQDNDDIKQILDFLLRYAKIIKLTK